MTKNQYTTTSSWRPKEQEEDKGQKATKPARQRAKQTSGQEMLHKCVVNFNWDTGKEKHRKQRQAPTNIKADNSQQCWETNEGRHAHQQQVGHIYSRKKRPPTPTVNCFFVKKPSSSFIFTLLSRSISSRLDTLKQLLHSFRRFSHMPLQQYSIDHMKGSMLWWTKKTANQLGWLQHVKSRKTLQFVWYLQYQLVSYHL